MLYKVAAAVTCCFNGSESDTAKMCLQQTSTPGK